MSDKLGRTPGEDLSARYAEEQPFNDQGIVRLEHRINGNYHGWYGLLNGGEYGLVVTQGKPNSKDAALAVENSAKRFAELKGLQLHFTPHKTSNKEEKDD